MAYERIAAYKPTGCELYRSNLSPNGVITPSGIGALCIVQLAGSTALWQCTVLPSTWVNLSAGGTGVPLSTVTASLANTSIDNTLFTETMAWSTATTQTLWSMTADALTSGRILSVTSASAAQTGQLALFQTASTGAFAAGAFAVAATAAHTGALARFSSATATGTVLQVVANSLTSGLGIEVTSSSATQTGALLSLATASTAALTGALAVIASAAHTGVLATFQSATATGTILQVVGNSLTSGIGIQASSTNTGLTGRLLEVTTASTGAFSNGGIRFQATGAHTANFVQIDTSTMTGFALSINVNSLTSGRGLSVVGTGVGLTGQIALFQSASTGALGNGAVRVNMTGAHTGNAVQIDTATVSGAALAVAGASLTTGNLVTLTANAITTGSMLSLTTTGGALNSTNGLLYVANSSVAAASGILARFQAFATAGSGVTMLANGNTGFGTSTPVATVQNAGSQLYGVSALGDFAAGGAIGTAGATVDAFAAFTVAQTTAGQTLSLPSPTSAVAGRLARVMNIGTQSFTMYGVVVTVAGVPATAGLTMMWNGSAWVVV